jgi:hypothetical protein
VPWGVRVGEALSAENGGSVEVSHDASEAVAGADIVYTDSWQSCDPRTHCAWRSQPARRAGCCVPPFQPCALGRDAGMGIDINMPVWI